MEKSVKEWNASSCMPCMQPLFADFHPNPCKSRRISPPQFETCDLVPRSVYRGREHRSNRRTKKLNMSRGGAGNIQAQAEAQAQLSSPTSTHHDLEAAHSPFHPETASFIPPQPQSNYAHSGRGGAGNWYEPKKQAQTGTYDTPYAIDSKKGQAPNGGMSQWAGRGGAGNFQGPTSSGSQEMSKEAAEASARAERDVEMGLPKPEKAFLGGKERTDDVLVGVESRTSGMEMTGVSL